MLTGCLEGMRVEDRRVAEGKRRKISFQILLPKFPELSSNDRSENFQEIEIPGRKFRFNEIFLRTLQLPTITMTHEVFISFKTNPLGKCSCACKYQNIVESTMKRKLWINIITKTGWPLPECSICIASRIIGFDKIKLPDMKSLGKHFSPKSHVDWILITKSSKMRTSIWQSNKSIYLGQKDLLKYHLAQRFSPVKFLETISSQKHFQAFEISWMKFSTKATDGKALPTEHSYTNSGYGKVRIQRETKALADFQWEQWKI